MSLYPIEGNGAWWCPETAFRTTAHGLDTANEAGDTFYAFPVDVTKIDDIQHLPKRGTAHTAGRADIGSIHVTGWESSPLTITGEMRNLSLLNYCCKGCTNAGPVGGVYTHTYATTTAREVPVPSFQILIRELNMSGSNNVFRLLTGCTIKSWSVAWSYGQVVTLTLEIIVANVIDGVALTTYPDNFIDTPYQAEYVNYSFKIATVAVPGIVVSFTITWDDGTIEPVNPATRVAIQALYKERNITIDWTFAPETGADIIATFTTNQPATAADHDLVISLIRDPGVDQVIFTFQKIWETDAVPGNWGYEGYYLVRRYKAVVKPTHYETGAVISVVETNTLSGARY